MLEDRVQLLAAAVISQFVVSTLLPTICIVWPMCKANHSPPPIDRLIKCRVLSPFTHTPSWSGTYVQKQRFRWQCCSSGLWRRVTFRNSILSPPAGLSMETVHFPKSQYLPTSPHCVTAQKNNNVIFSAVRKLQFHTTFTYTENLGMMKIKVKINCLSFILNRLIRTVYILCQMTNILFVTL
jgi:hypothetical protein